MTLPTSYRLKQANSYGPLRRAARVLASLVRQVGQSLRREPQSDAALARRAEGGYTLTEIMIALAIVSMMLGGAAVYAFGQFEKARKKETINMMRKIKDGVLQWRMDATGGEQCPSGLADLVTSKVFNKEPKDGWGRQFVFKCPGDHDTDGVDLVSFGKDGKEGTADDIKSWDEEK
jgi:general secretion pathway protein G